MIGLINNVLEAFVTDTFGADTWVKVLQESGQASSYPWVSTCPLSDKVTYDLVITAAGLLGVSVAYALEAFGRYFVSFLKNNGYVKLLLALGGDIVELLDNLNTMHIHLGLAYPAMQAPDFRCENMTPESVELHYYSHRPSLGPIVVGILKAMATDFFKLELTVELLKTRDEGHDHEVFFLKFPPQEHIRNRMTHTIKRSPASRAPFGLKPELFAELHPFHVIVDRHFIILQCGRVLRRLCPGMQPGNHLAEHLKIRRPSIQFIWSEVLRNTNGPFLLTTLHSGLELKGQMLCTTLNVPGCPAKADAIVFMGYPHCANLAELKKHGVYLSDIPKHKLCADYVILAEQRQAEADMLAKFEQLTLDLQEEKLRSEAVLKRMAGLLSCIPNMGDVPAPHESGLHSSLSQLKIGLLPAATRNSTFLPVSLQFRSGIGGLRSQGGQSKVEDRMNVIEAVKRAMGPSTSPEDLDERLHLVETIGEGTYGKVYIGCWEGTEVAVKTMVIPANMSGADRREKAAIMEAAISTSLSHPNIVQTYTYSIRTMRDSAPAEVASVNDMDDMFRRSPNHEGTAVGASAAAAATGTAEATAAAEAGTIGKIGDARVASYSPSASPSTGTCSDPSNALLSPIIEADADGEEANGPCVSRPVVGVMPLPHDMFLATAIEPSRLSPAHASAKMNTPSSGPVTKLVLDMMSGLRLSGGRDGSVSGGRAKKMGPQFPSHIGRKSTSGTLTMFSRSSRNDCHDNPSIHDSSITSYEIRLVLEYCSMGSLRDALNKDRFRMPDNSVDFKAIIETAMEISRAMIHIHKNRVVHADLKARNILLKVASEKQKGFVSKVADFGLSMKLEKSETHISDMQRGTLTHMAPEVLLHGTMSKAADIYAFGILLWELYTAGSPFKGVPKALLGHKVAVADERPVFVADTPEEYKKLAEWCWSKDPKIRPTFEEVLGSLGSMQIALQKIKKVASS